MSIRFCALLTVTIAAFVAVTVGGPLEARLSGKCRNYCCSGGEIVRCSLTNTMACSPIEIILFVDRSPDCCRTGWNSLHRLGADYALPQSLYANGS